MNSDPKKTEVNNGNQIAGGSELSDAELDKVTGGDVSAGVEPLSERFINEILAPSNMRDLGKAGAAAGAAGGATKPKPA